MVKVNKHLKGFTLMETIVALVIVMLSFGLAMLLFTQVENSRRTAIKMKAVVAMEEIALQAVELNRYLDDRIEYDAFYIEKKCFPYQEGSNALVLELASFMKNNEKIGERKEILILKKP